ncbi:hypothetical protein MSG28_003598 [Choristoneura fumiferana]|uniref:Uncharacterized protein n=1 Tax=Choristoneura fumiferana TaxID=7141 RepID=A0ACC0KFQ5_CHOFU|nr:hypothetical protein MSG28_003598 [Choristoneura fumiferana]
MANQAQKIVYKLVLTGGYVVFGFSVWGSDKIVVPHCVYFQVFRVPETATVLLSGGVKFADLTPDEGEFIIFEACCG